MKKIAVSIRIIFCVLTASGFAALLSCNDSDSNEGGASNLPYGEYKSAYYSTVALRNDNTFYIKHDANAEDTKDYTIEGTFTHTTEVIDEENDTYGKIDLVCTKLTVDGMDVPQITGTFCDESMSCSEPVLYLNDILLGWWVYSDNITWGGKMRIHLNYPPNLRPEGPFTGSRSLISVDPK